MNSSAFNRALIGMPRIALVGAALLLVANTSCAASFDCAKAGTKVEKMICSDPELSRLDEDLSAAYSKALKENSDPSSLKQQQRGWMKERNKCVDKDCLKASCQARIHALLSLQERLMALPSVEQSNSVSPFASDMVDKTKAVQRILTKKTFNVSAGSYEPNQAFCEGFLKDFQQMQEVEFLMPVIQSDKYADPAWDSYKASCPDLELFDSYECEPRIADYLETLAKKERKEMAKTACRHYRGSKKFKLFVVDVNDDPDDGIEHVFYWEHEQGPLNRPGQELINTNGGYKVVDAKSCQTKGGVQAHDPYSYNYLHPLENYNGIITYKGKHYVFDLFELDVKARTPEKTTYELTLSGYSNFGKKRPPWLGPVCSFSTFNIKHD